MKISFQIVSVIVSHCEARSAQIQDQGRLENSECKPGLRSRKQQLQKRGMGGNYYSFCRNCSQIWVQREAEKERKMKENNSRLSFAEKR